MISESVNTLWLLTASFLVLLMQAGFLLLEGGRVRSKNSINVAQKNVSDLMVAWVAYFLFGFAIMYGIYMPVRGDAYPSPLHFLFQLGFCATAASIVSGGVAERMRFVPYLVLAALVGAVIYPVVGRLTWGDSFKENSMTWLADIGFVDFAGATVVHGVGGWAALVAILMIGPRIDRFDEQGKPRPLASHSSIMSLQGTLLLAFGWIGFNAGTLSVTDTLFSEVIVNTFSAAAFGAAGGAAVGAWLDKGVFNPPRTINGLLGGLVISTAAIHVMGTYSMMICGFIGGALITWIAQYMLDRWKFDDPVDVVATHGIGGLFGTLLYAFFAPIETLVGGSRMLQFGVQLAGAGTVFIIVTVSTFMVLKITSKFVALRVSNEDELIGLNYTEHGESIGTDRLQRALNEQLTSSSNFSGQIDVSAEDEHADLAATVNRLIAKQEDARRVLAASEKKFQQFANTASDWLWESDHRLQLRSMHVTNDGRHLDSELMWQGKKLLEVVQLDDEKLATFEHSLAAVQAFGPLEGCINIMSSTNLIVEVRGTPHFSEEQELIGFRGTITDITARKLAENRAVFLSMHDELTGLMNRRALQQELPRLMQVANTNEARIALIGIDLDGFKSVNDSYGHPAGDLLLEVVAERIDNLIPKHCDIYRTGGDEFALLIANLDGDDYAAKVDKIATDLLDSIREPIEYEDKELKVAASLGVAVFPIHASNPEDLVRRADLAMYSAKYQGKSMTVWFSEELDDDLDHRFKLEAELKRAIADNNLFLVYQPMFDAVSEEVKSFEALIRWHHPKKGELAPKDFIDIIEKHGLMNLLGEFVIDTACAFASTWEAPPGQNPPPVSVNISPSHLMAPEFTQTVLKALENSELAAGRLVLEITEDSLIVDHEKTMEIITTLEKYGVSFSIDDFGTGQTSLRYLSNFPVRTLKIDQSFIRNLGKNERANEITRSMISMGARLGYSVVAEGVEDITQLEMLKHWNCPVVQGFMFSKPVSETQVLELLNNEARNDKRKAS